MEMSQSALAQMLTWSFLLGVALGPVYDSVRLIRVLFRLGDQGERAWVMLGKIKLPLVDKKRVISSRMGRAWRFLVAVVLFMLDLAFSLICGVAFILLQYYANDGVPRAFSLFGMLAGFFLYYCSLGKLTGAVLWRLAVIVRILFAYISLPFEYFVRGLRERAVRRKAKREEKKRMQKAQEVRPAPLYQRLLPAPKGHTYKR